MDKNSSGTNLENREFFLESVLALSDYFHAYWC